MRAFVPKSVRGIWPSYEDRPEQEIMSRKVADALEGGGMLAIEAGTGVGKTLAYLIPLLRAALLNDFRVVVSTETVSLQRQILGADLDLACRILGEKVQAELCLGASNYVCKRRFTDVMSKGDVPLRMAAHLDEFLEWEATSATGVRSDYSGVVVPEFWDKISRDPDDCLGRKCPNFEISPYFVAKERWRRAKLLVVNHSLLTNHLVRENRILPEFACVVIDEAHRFPEYFVRAMAATAGLGEMHNVLRDLRHTGGADTKYIKDAFESFKTAVINGLGLFPGQRKRLRQGLAPEQADDLIAAYDGKIKDLESELADHEPGAEAVAGMGLAVARLREHRAMADRIARPPEDAWVHYAARPENDARMNIVLTCSPVLAGRAVREHLCSQAQSIIFTSATLAANGKDPFAYFIRETGWDSASDEPPVTERLDSPFDYAERCILYLPPGIPDPQTDEESFHDACADRILALTELSRGGAFVLFTSARSLSAVRARVEGALSARGLEAFDQVEMGSTRALALFQKSDCGVLFGLATFWQGVDIPGDALRLVILVRIPFKVPDEPQLEARMEIEKAAGRNPFMTVQLPQAVISMKQGFGRLIRSKEDRGVVAILDPRLQTKFYGKDILAALPRAKVVRDFGQLAVLYRSLFKQGAARVTRKTETPGRTADADT